ncbi:MAG TPA: SDR family oxidoreductase [Sphingobium sp.]|nr:SDR family oxidoreductase [Sphingobium sp.]
MTKREDGRLAGKVAIITGASTGCGPEMAKLFVREGACVLLAARRLELVERAAAEAGEGAIAIRADITSEADVRAMVARCMDGFGQVDILLNNAATPGQDKYIWEQTLDNWNATIAVDLTGAMLCTREVLNQSMLARKAGSIVNFSSTAGFSGQVRKGHYVSAKAALRAFTKNVALEVGQYGIRCNCLVPGAIETELFKNWVNRLSAEQGVAPEDFSRDFLSHTALQTISQPQDIANLALFLASDESRTITGQSIVIDAGHVLHG